MQRWRTNWQAPCTHSPSTRRRRAKRVEISCGTLAVVRRESGHPERFVGWAKALCAVPTIFLSGWWARCALPTLRFYARKRSHSAAGLKSRSRALRLFLFQLALARDRDDSKRGDAVALAAEHAETEPVEGKTLAALRNRTGFVNDEACDRGCFLVRQIPVHRAIDVADRNRAIDHHRAVGLGADAGHHDILLVGNVADDLFQDILQRHHAFDFAVLVDHQREMRLAAAERLELFGDRAHFRNEPRRQRDAGDVDPRHIAVGGTNG